ncbi:unnamed protein product [Absidia cylindrospora]
MSIATVSRSEPVPIPNTSNPASFSYKEIVRNLTANAPQPYGAIPPLMKKRKQKKKKRQSQQPQAVRRMSHVENWIAVDSKESLPDEEELIHSPFQNFLPLDFLTGILPLHMPPPSLSDPTTFIQQQEIAAITEHHRRKASHQFTSSPGTAKGTISADGIFTQDGDDNDQDDEDDDLEEDDDIFDEYDDIDDDDESDLSPPASSSSLSSSSSHHDLLVEDSEAHLVPYRYHQKERYHFHRPQPPTMGILFKCIKQLLVDDRFLPSPKRIHLQHQQQHRLLCHLHRRIKIGANGFTPSPSYVSH